MTGRRAYEMFTRAFGKQTYWRPRTQFGDGPLVAYDDLTSDEKAAWKAIARQIDQRTARVLAAKRAAS